MRRPYTLGLDLGSNSVGWAVVFDEPRGDEGNIVLGARIFPEGTDKEKGLEEPRNLKRQTARSARRLLDRRSRRKRNLRSIFRRAGVFPKDREEQAALMGLDPYELRARGLDEALEPSHFARAIMHLGQRRGFKSNLKAQGDQAKEEKGIKAEITDLGKTIAGAGARTLGEYLWGLKKEYDRERDREARGEEPPECKRVRNRYTARQMYVDEFEALWEAQARFHPEVWTDALRQEVYETIFFQRPLKPQDHLIGRCELEPEEPRAARASWLAQQVRMLQEVNNFRILTRGRGERELTEGERQAVVEKLSSQASPVKIDTLCKKVLKLADVESLNYERTGRDKIEGNWIEARLRKIFANDYEKRADWIRETVWEGLIHLDPEPFREMFLKERQKEKRIGATEDDNKRDHRWRQIEGEGGVECAQGKLRVVEDALSRPYHKGGPRGQKRRSLQSRRDRLRNMLVVVEKGATHSTDPHPEWKLTPKQVDELFKVKRVSGYAAYSLKAMEKLLPHLEAGLSIHDAREKAGYKPAKPDTMDHLPPVEPGTIRNPVVTRALSETRKVVNALIREYGIPRRIVVELARETKGTIPSRQKRNREMRDRESHRESVAKELEKLGVPVNHDSIEKYLLWEECEQVCPYTGISISVHELFGDATRFQVEHILPRSRSFDNGFLNKTLCEVGVNKEKENRTPWEAFHGDAERYEKMLVRVQRNPNMAYEKKRRFSMREIPEDFTERQLRDTSYIATVVTEYLKRLDGVQVRTTRGPITAELRYQWGLQSILSDDGKKSRDDHRHHAVDALAVALTNALHVKALAYEYEQRRERQLPSPWASAGMDVAEFRRQAVSAVEAICVSHRPQHRVQGQLTEETNYGPTAEKGVFSLRVPLASLTTSMVGDVADATVRGAIEERLREHGIDPKGKARSIPAAVFREPLRMPRRHRGKGPMIKTVRVRRSKSMGEPVAVRNREGKPYRYLKTGSNHHIAIYEYRDEKGKMKRCKECVTRFEAMQRLRRRESVVRRHHPEFPEAKFLMSLSINDMVWARKDAETPWTLCRVQSLSGGAGQDAADIFFRHHTAATIDSKETLIRVRSLGEEKFHVRKVQMDSLGRIRPAHD